MTDTTMLHVFGWRCDGGPDVLRGLEQEAPDDDPDGEHDESEQSELGDLGLQHSDLRNA